MVQGLQRLRHAYDAVLLDLDGTLLDGRSELTPRTIAAVRALVDAGFVVMVCTGRSVIGARDHHAALGLDTAMVTYNGSWIGWPGQEPVHYLPIPDAHVAPVFGAESMAQFSFRHRSDQKFTVMTEHPEHHQVANWFQNVVRADGHHELPTDDLMRVSLFIDEREVAVEEVAGMWTGMPDTTQAALHIETFPLRMFPTYEDSRMMLYEVQGRSRGKAEALYWLERDLGIAPSRTIAVGDHMNDLTMLESAGLAVTPANGVDAARALADLVIGHHAEEGLAAWIEEGAPVGARA